jgi:putative membrane protein
MNKIISIFSVFSILIFVGSMAFGNGGHVKNIDEILTEIREDLGLDAKSPINPDLVSDQHLEELGEAVMDLMHPNVREHEFMDNMMGGEGSESLDYMHRMMGYRYLTSEDKSLGFPMTGRGMMGIGLMGGMPMMGWGMHHGWGGGNNGLFLRSMRGGFLGFYIWRVSMWIVLLGVIGVVIWLVVRSQKQHGTYRQPEEDLPIEIAKRRYAKGEISREEFETIKRDLQ